MGQPRRRLTAANVASRVLSFDLLLVVVVAGAVVPLWVVDRLPLQDLPQHLVAIRALIDYHDPTLSFERFFEIDLWSTQYVAYYLAAAALAIPLGVTTANTLLLSATLAATPYAMRSLLRALGHDPRLCLFVLPLLYNVHLILGFLNFVAAIPLMLYGLALAARLRSRWSGDIAAGLAAVALLLFLTHVVPFGLFGLGALALAIERRVGPTLRRLLPLAPATLAALLWSQASPAGQATMEAALGGAVSSTRARFDPIGVSIRHTGTWLTDVLYGSADEIVLGSSLLLALIVLLHHAGARLAGRMARQRASTIDEPIHSSQGQPSEGRPSEGQPSEGQPSEARLSLRARLVWLAPLCALLYVFLPRSYGWIWPINARFPLLALVFGVLLLPRLRPIGGKVVVLALALVSAYGFVEVGRAFVTVEQKEMGRLDEAIDSIPHGSKLVGLIFDRDSRIVRFSPFLHSVAWVQVEKGGAAMFSFADFPQSPLRFRDQDRPPRVPPRWEWSPGLVRPDRDLLWYDYVLVRGRPGAMARSSAFEPIVDAEPWRVYRRSADPPLPDHQVPAKTNR